ncbi:flagellar hook assembly protein FlgD [Fusibacter sp. 3D3]|uniref:flagellar hook assembly protein FlgD n=1 Tax=Fusibacter sp. 3D3 TaxID=1048380 RepID=UPI0008538EBA|nr:flagellar hook capping FlgD N-terminal domain-containing protein [Fusibacter sp. 3D3]GAU79872.1 flagellar basal-body rod modification protein FlgD [Fusibacter sp. 3D3]
MAFPISGVITSGQYEKLNKISDNEDNTKRLATQTLDKDSFLKLMMTQLQNQDPLEPMDNSQTIAQMAQFTSVEQLTNISEAMETNISISTTMAEQLVKLTAAIETMNTKGTGSSEEVKTAQTKIIEQNESMVNELIKLNKALSSYFGTTDNSTSADLLASLGK